VAFAGVARPLSSPAPALAELERLIELAGYGLTQVSVTGHRYTLDSDIFDAIGLENAHTMLSFDTRAAQDRIERLPWVERASIERVPPRPPGGAHLGALSLRRLAPRRPQLPDRPLGSAAGGRSSPGNAVAAAHCR
jgi:hypothetical protein